MGNCLCPDKRPADGRAEREEVSLSITDVPVSEPTFDEGDVCPVCLDALQCEKPVLTAACCKRAFHSVCLDLSLRATKNLCPLCRQVLCVPDPLTTVTCSFDRPVSEQTRLKVLALVPGKLSYIRNRRP